MAESINGYEISQKGKNYILLIYLQENDLIIICINKTSKDFFFSKKYNLSDLYSMSKYFRIYYNIKEIQTILNNAIEKTNIGLLEDFNQITIFFKIRLGLEENTISFSLNKESNKSQNSKLTESNDVNDNKEYIKVLENTIENQEKERKALNQNFLKILEEKNKLNIEYQQLMKKLNILEENNYAYKNENEILKEYKNKYEEVMKEKSKDKKLFKNKLSISSINKEKFLGKNEIKNVKNENNKENQNLNLNEQNYDDDYNTNIIDNDNYENESEPKIEIKVFNKDITKKNYINNIENNLNKIQKGNDEKLLFNKLNDIEEKEKEIEKEIIHDDKMNDKNGALNLNIKSINIVESPHKQNESINDSNRKKSELEIKNDNHNNESNNNKNEREDLLNKEKEEININKEEININKEEAKNNIDEDSEQEIEFIRNNEIVNESNKKFDEIEADIEKNINNEIKEIDNNKMNIEENGIKEINEKEGKKDMNIKNNDNENNNKDNLEKIFRESINLIEINEKPKLKQDLKDIEKTNNIQNIHEEIKDAQNNNSNNKNDNIRIGNNNNEQKKEEIKIDKEILKQNENTYKENEIIKEKEEINNINNKSNKDLKEKEVVINHIEKKNKDIINKLVINENKNDEIKKEEFNIKNIKDNKYENSLNKEKEEIEISNPKLDKIEINTKVSYDSKIANNTNYELELDNSIITKIDDMSETSNYFYNDQINDTYRPSDFKKLYIKPIQNKISNFNLDSKNISQIFKKDNKNLKSGIIQNISELDFISNRIHKSKYKININLIYKASINGDKSSIFHDKCNKAQTTLILIQTKNNQKFGGFTKRTWRGNNIEKTDNDAFIFSLDKNKIYNINKGKNAIGCFAEYIISFSGAFSIYDNALDKGGFLIKNENNFDIKDINELLGDDNFENNDKENSSKEYNEKENNNINFDIKDIEVYEIKIA